MRFQSVLAYTVAVAMTFVILATFMGMPYLSHQLVAVTGLKVSPAFTGGEPQQTIQHDGYTTIIRQPVFTGLLQPASEGFIQIDWQTTAALPPVLSETIDYDLDGNADFQVTYDVEQDTATLDPYRSGVQSIMGTYTLKSGRAIRVALKN